MTDKFWLNKRVLVTGHTGFKGGWLSLWLNELGVDIHGFSLPPTLHSVFYNSVYAEGFVWEETFADISVIQNITECIETFKPQVIFHLAAQPLVRMSYDEPLSTFHVNSMGVVNLLEAVRRSGIEPVVVNVTTDKVYANKEWVWAYREPEALGGNDPYSASKACSEIITHSYMKSYFVDTLVKVSTARAGNVIGGGDMSPDRLIPDYLRAISHGGELTIRNPLATRPWQHVLEPLSGYLNLAEKMFLNISDEYTGAWNFGPSDDPASVGEVISKISNIAQRTNFKIDEGSNPHEAQSLMLDSAKARSKLGWRPKLNLDQSLKMTFDWFQKFQQTADMSKFTKSQIREYSNIE